MRSVSRLNCRSPTALENLGNSRPSSMSFLLYSSILGSVSAWIKGLEVCVVMCLVSFLFFYNCFVFGSLAAFFSLGPVDFGRFAFTSLPETLIDAAGTLLFSSCLLCIIFKDSISVTCLERGFLATIAETLVAVAFDGRCLPLGVNLVFFIC